MGNSNKRSKMKKGIKKVMLISGGISAEREISLISGKEVAKSLDRLGHKIIHVDANLNLLEKIEESKPDVIFNKNLCRLMFIHSNLRSLNARMCICSLT